MALAKATLTNVSVTPPVVTSVMFNPTDYGIDRGATYAELDVPGLKTPILQFIRGETQTLSIALFLDGSDARQPVKAALQALRKFVSIDSDLHSPPVCLFEWGDVRFQGVVTALKEKFSLFDGAGKVVRATVTLTLKSYEAVEVQIRDMKRSSPDRTRVRTVRDGETLAQLANEAYADPRLWRAIATQNNIDRPRFLTTGQTLQIPAV
ncbi:MAG: LysM peptidoglycan-binding domain-containing protein [Isosphaeraceae bacterium]